MRAAGPRAWIRAATNPSAGCTDGQLRQSDKRVPAWRLSCPQRSSEVSGCGRRSNTHGKISSASRSPLPSPSDPTLSFRCGFDPVCHANLPHAAVLHDAVVAAVTGVTVVSVSMRKIADRVKTDPEPRFKDRADPSSIRRERLRLEAGVSAVACGSDAHKNNNPASTPILLTHTPTRCRVIPVAGIKLGIGRRRCVASDAEQRTEGVERAEASVEPKREFVEVGL